METKPIIITFAVVIVVIVTMVFLQSKNTPNVQPESEEYNAFATCIADSGAIFYGAYWCSHCNAQKEAFGASAKLLPYVECSTPDGRGQTAACAKANITSYPTWVFADGSQQKGRVPLEQLAEKTSCALPIQTQK